MLAVVGFSVKAADVEGGRINNIGVVEKGIFSVVDICCRWEAFGGVSTLGCEGETKIGFCEDELDSVKTTASCGSIRLCCLKENFGEILVSVIHFLQ
jgi:hypothetical protein